MGIQRMFVRGKVDGKLYFENVVIKKSYIIENKLYAQIIYYKSFKQVKMITSF